MQFPVARARPLHAIGLFLALLGAGLLAGCNVVESTQEFVKRPDGTLVQRCKSQFGSYSLAYSLLEVEVRQRFTDNPGGDKLPGTPVGGPIVTFRSDRHFPDNQHIYCLEYLEASSAHDIVSVNFGKDSENPEKTPNGLLSSIISRNVDETGTFLRKIIRALFVFISGSANGYDDGRADGTERGTTTDPKLQTRVPFDPFDLADMVMLNTRLNEFGVCVTLGKYTYDTEQTTPSQYCDSPQRYYKKNGRPRKLDAALQQTYLVKHLPKGVYYRPRQHYPVYVYFKDDPGYPGPWRLRKTAYVSLENISPVLSLGITRAMFAEKRLLLAFDEGNLLGVCLIKGSEAQGALAVPLEIIFGAIALPGNVLKHQIELANGTSQLLAKQQELLDAQNKFIDYLAGNEEMKIQGTNKTYENTNNKASFSHPIAESTTNKIEPPGIEAKFDSSEQNICEEIKKDKFEKYGGAG